jgi:type IV pilus assembly protein PilQ
VTPQITPDDQIILNVDINKDSRGQATPGGLAINTKHVKTQVQVENDGTVVIGGIYTETVSDAEAKLPLLGDLPVLGHLFKNTEKLHDKTELLIFLTPRIVGGEDAR